MRSAMPEKYKTMCTDNFLKNSEDNYIECTNTTH